MTDTANGPGAGAAPGTAGHPDLALPEPSDPGAPRDSRGLRVASAWSVAGFALAVLPPFSVFGLAASIVGIVLSRRAGRLNRLAVAGVLLALVLMAAGIALLIALGSSGFAVFGTPVGSTVWVCTELGPGEHVVDGLRYACS